MGQARRIAGLAMAGVAAGAVTLLLNRRWADRPPQVTPTPHLAPPTAPEDPTTVPSGDASAPAHLGEPDPFSEQTSPTSARAAGPGREDTRDRQRQSSPWLRENFHGETVSLVAGPALAGGCAVGVVLAPGVPARVRVAGAGTSLLIGVVGAYDDLMGDSSSRGLRGHLGALRTGNVTTGAVKVAVIGLTGVAGAALVSKSFVDTLIGGAVVAGHANLLNLLDLRPGRAGKVALLHAPLVLSGPAAGVGASALGAVVASLPDDLGERTMLGDAGANALGGMLGLAMVAREGRAARAAHLAVVTALTLASEKVSFTRVIERTPVLRHLDQLGRRT